MYNDLAGLKKTVASVLNQTCKDYEYIILDGGSTDGCVEYMDSLQFHGKKKSEKDSGIYNAMNKAVKMAEGDYCLFLNAGDTLYDETVLEQAAQVLQDDDFYVGKTMEIGEKSISRDVPVPMTIGYLIRESIFHQSTFTRRQLLLDHPYSERLSIVSDWALFFERWLYGSSFKILDFYVSNYYLGGFSSKHRDMLEQERYEVVKRLIPSRILEFYIPEETDPDFVKLVNKVERAMRLSPIQRDFKLLRNAIKSLIKDLF